MTAAPLQFDTLGLDRELFVRSDAKSYRGPCPRCGGRRRLLVFVDHPFPKWHVQCDGCGLKAWADQLNIALRQPVTAEQKAEWHRRDAAAREAEGKRRQERLANFTTTELWTELNRRMTAEHRRQWEAWGVPGEWQDYLKIGYHPSRSYIGRDGEKHVSTAYAIPFFYTGWQFKTMQYRLNDPDISERYRFTTGLGTAYYQVEPDQPIGERVLICEGAKKAIVAHVHGATGCTILAVPSKSDFAGVADAVRGCGQVYVLLDPDADHRAHQLAASIGPTARVVTLPVKVDDALLHYGATPALLATYLRHAVK